MRQTLLCSLLATLVLGHSPWLFASSSAQLTNPHWQDASLGMDFRWIDAGCFMMGSEQTVLIDAGNRPEGARPDEQPQHEVCVDGFWLGAYEVTKRQWRQIMGDAPDSQNDSDHPVSGVSWLEVHNFLDTINSKAEQQNSHYRLPTEAEWEYACNSILSTDTKGTHPITRLDSVAWFDYGRQNTHPEPVGRKQPSSLGLYDMLGNVWEWTTDEYQQHGYQLHSRLNPLVDQGGEKRVIRGGSYRSGLYQARCQARNYTLKDDPLPTVGLRLVRVPNSNAASGTAAPTSLTPKGIADEPQQ